MEPTAQTKATKGHWSICILLMWIIVHAIDAQQQIENMLEFELREEDGDQTIGNIATRSRIDQLYSAEELKLITYQFLSPTAPHMQHFRLEATTGILRAVTSLDRDALCRHEPSCDIQVGIVTGPRDYMHLITVTIHLIDINDNPPTFEEDQLRIDIPESTESGTTFALPSAYDADIGQFGIQGFTLSPQLANFALDVNISPDGSLNLHLIVVQRVDREQQASYSLQVLVRDGGSPVKSGTLALQINVLDANDNPPRFTNATYRVTVEENIAIGQTICELTATDRDAGLNGQIEYEFARSTNNSHGDLFGIDVTSGHIYTRRQLDYEEGSLYILSVLARDNGVNPLSTYTSVDVLVTDLNDNAPQITVNALTKRVEVPENGALNDFVAHVVIDDADSGANGRVSCSLPSAHFKLEYLYRSEYQILATTVFDRERQDVYSVELRCTDHGDRPRTTTKIIPVYISDENDNEPRFESDSYVITIDEANRHLSYIGAITAADLDVAQNANVTYTIAQTAPPLTPGSPQALVVNSGAGLLYANIVFDYESETEYTFTITATDHGRHPLSSSAVLNILLNDVNDEAPVFESDNYIFGTFENQPANTEIGTVTATDRDKSENFREVSYDLDPRFTDVATFGIDNSTGRLFTKKVLDREVQSDYVVTVVAFNRGTNLLTSSNVTVHVADKNDNVPVFLFPTSTNNSVTIKGNHGIHDTVTYVMAEDVDVGMNAELTYGLNYGNDDGYFSVDASSGELTLTKRLEADMFDQMIALLVTVEDGGNPVLTESETLYVYVNGSFDSATASKQRDAANNNVAIVVICVLVFVITCIILVLLTLFYLRRKAIGQHCHQRHTKYDGTNVDSAQAPACMDTSSNSIRTDVSDVSTAKASFRGGHTISYVPADDPGTASYASPYVEVSILMYL